MNHLVSVIIPVYNLSPYISDCIRSIIGQTYENLEIIVIDDGCKDDSIAIVESFADKRVRILKNEENLGLATSVNKAIRISQGLFIARMDGDDIAVNTRIAQQVDFLLKNPSVSVLGSAMQSFGYSKYTHIFPLSHDRCKAQLLFNVCFGHPTVMFRKDVFNEITSFYRDDLKQYSEEYELWCRLVDSYTFANLPDVLLYYRTFAPSEKSDATTIRKKNSFAIRKSFIINQLNETSESSFVLHDHICNLERAIDRIDFQEWMNWLKKIEALNNNTSGFSKQDLSKELARRRFEIHYWNTHLGLPNWLNYINNSEFTYKAGLLINLKFLLKSALTR